jgi:hypothetical protein
MYRSSSGSQPREAQTLGALERTFTLGEERERERGREREWSRSGSVRSGGTAGPSTQRSSLTACSLPASPNTTLMAPGRGGAAGLLAASLRRSSGSGDRLGSCNGTAPAPSSGLADAGTLSESSGGGGLFGGAGFKLFGEVEVEFEEQHTYEQQEEEEEREAQLSSEPAAAQLPPAGA